MTFQRKEPAVRFDPDRDLTHKIADTFVLSAVGDIVPAKPIGQRRDPGLAAVRDLLQSADVSFGNMEAVLRPVDTDFDGANMWEGPFLTQAPPECADDLAGLGIGMMQFASNRSHDWGIEGQRFTRRTLRDAGIAVAGAGENLAEARGAVYCETPAGTVGLVGTTAAFTRLGNYGIAGAVRGKSRGRPGLNGLRFKHVVKLTPDDFNALRDFARTRTYAFPGQVPVQPMFFDGDGEFQLDDRIYRPSDMPGYSYEMDPLDLAEIKLSIRNAKIASNIVVASLHYHQWSIDPENPVAGHSGQTDEAPDLVRKFAHEAIASGADIVLCHGPGDVRAIEIIDGKPAFYGLGNFIRNPYVQNIVPIETFTAQNRPQRGRIDPNSVETSDNEVATRVMPPHPRQYFESVLARIHFDTDGLTRIDLHPMDLRFDAPIADIGIPRPAGGELSDTILNRLTDRCARYGTKVAIEDGIGVIRPGEAQ